MKYIIVEDCDKYQMQESVNAKLKDGYKISGSLCVTLIDGMLLYAQAMVKHSKMTLVMK